jgi:hypothetical protein
MDTVNEEMDEQESPADELMTTEEFVFGGVAVIVLLLIIIGLFIANAIWPGLVGIPK